MMSIIKSAVCDYYVWRQHVIRLEVVLVFGGLVGGHHQEGKLACRLPNSLMLFFNNLLSI
jgi:hypothetical protein